MTDLIPCPFCGGEFECRIEPLDGDYHVVCGCGIEGPLCFNQIKAAEVWNTRAPSHMQEKPMNTGSSNAGLEKLKNIMLKPAQTPEEWTERIYAILDVYPYPRPGFIYDAVISVVEHIQQQARSSALGKEQCETEIIPTKLRKAVEELDDLDGHVRVLAKVIAHHAVTHRGDCTGVPIACDICASESYAKEVSDLFPVLLSAARIYLKQLESATGIKE